MVCITVQVSTKTQSYQTKQAGVKKVDHLRAILAGDFMSYTKLLS